MVKSKVSGVKFLEVEIYCETFESSFSVVLLWRMGLYTSHWSTPVIHTVSRYIIYHMNPHHIQRILPNAKSRELSIATSKLHRYPHRIKLTTSYYISLHHTLIVFRYHLLPSPPPSSSSSLPALSLYSAFTICYSLWPDLIFCFLSLLLLNHDKICAKMNYRMCFWSWLFVCKFTAMYSFTLNKMIIVKEIAKTRLDQGEGTIVFIKTEAIPSVFQLFVSDVFARRLFPVNVLLSFIFIFFFSFSLQIKR